MLDGYKRRREALEDLLILHCALPVYRGFYGKKAPTFKKLTAYRQSKRGTLPRIDPELLAKWKPIL